MVAPSIFLNSRCTFWTLFGICIYPVRCFGVIFTFLDPHFHQLAECWLMVVESTSKAKSMLASTCDCRNDFEEIFLPHATIDGILTIWCWAPFEVVLVIDISSCEEYQVSARCISLGTKGPTQPTYLDRRSVVTSRSNDFESTIRWHLFVGHCILAASPSSLIFWARYCL